MKQKPSILFSTGGYIEKSKSIFMYTVRACFCDQ